MVSRSVWLTTPLYLEMVRLVLVDNEILLEIFIRTEGDGWSSDGLQGGLAVLGEGQRADLHHHAALQELLHTRHGHHPQERRLNVLHVQDEERIINLPLGCQ